MPRMQPKTLVFLHDKSVEQGNAGETPFPRPTRWCPAAARDHPPVAGRRTARRKRARRARRQRPGYPCDNGRACRNRGHRGQAIPRRQRGGAGYLFWRVSHLAGHHDTILAAPGRLVGLAGQCDCPVPFFTICSIKCAWGIRYTDPSAARTVVTAWPMRSTVPDTSAMLM